MELRLMHLMGFEVFKAVNMNIGIPWNVAMCSLGYCYQRFGVSRWNVLSISWTPSHNILEKLNRHYEISWLSLYAAKA
jgi:hypothetical protein